ncbi:hypothetical protein PLESTB_000085100 [Pleodorina starrii]|uniref:Uncharacterized protein n=1 Tax=Pleodorina starrii TaxID=330485 RepID=A0A9W6BB02_9CHLO|nr:hypothetical protein PLESTB_000085100 [Pleodorina starrii]
MSQQQVMTNLGPRRKGSARLEPLPFGNGRTSPSDGGDAAPALPDGRSPSAHLPPLNRTKDAAAETFDSVLVDDVSPGVSPARRARKAALLTRSAMESDHRTVLQASLALDQKEREMALIRDNKREYGRILLELWVNQVLDATGGSGHGHSHGGGGGPGGLGAAHGLGDPLKVDPSALKGLATYGLTRVELLGAGLSNEAIDRLYRCMYVYTVGFFDVMQDLLAHNEFRAEILSNVWKGFLTIAESALQVSFRSDFLKLFQSQQVAMAELLFAKEQLAEAKQDSVNTEQAVAWLTNAHAEERAARQVLKGQVAELSASLELERQAHQAAVTKYVAEVEERVRLQAQLVSATAKLSDAAVAQADLIMQRDQLTAELAAAEERAVRILDHVKSVFEALALEKALKPHSGLVSSLDCLLRAAADADGPADGGVAAAATAAAAAAAAASAAAPGGGALSAESSSYLSSVIPSLSSNPVHYGSVAAAALATAVSSAPPSSTSLAASVSLAPPSAFASSSLLPSVEPSSSAVESSSAAETRRQSAAGGGRLGGGGASVADSSMPLVLPSLDAPARAEATVLFADLIADMTKQLYGMWREQTETTATTARSLYEVRDNLRTTKIHEHELQVELEKTRAMASNLQKTLAEVDTDLRATQGSLKATEDALAALTSAKADADRDVEELTRNLEDTRTLLESVQVERNRLLATSRALQLDVETRDLRIGRLERRLTTAGNSLAEVSRAMVIYAKSAAAQDIARGYYKKQFLEASKRAGDLQWSLFRTERQVRTLEGKMEARNNEMVALTAASESAKHAADQVQTSLTAALLDIENRKAMIGSLERALLSAKEDCDKVKQDLENTLRRAEEAELGLEEAREEIQRQSDGMQSLEARISAAAEERQKLLKQVERLVAEKTELERTFKQQRDSLQAEISRRGTEIASLRNDGDSLNLHIEGLTADLAAVRELLERKREKKRRWKALQAQYQQQAESLRGALAEREGLVAELSARLEPLEVDVAVLMADRGREVSGLGDDGEKDVTPGSSDQAGDIDIIAEQQAWDEVTHLSLELSSRLETQQRSVEAARREYETARASFYEAPTEESRKTVLLGIEAVLAKLRVERAETEADLSRLRDRQLAIQGRVQAYENAAFKRRMATLERRTGKAELVLKNELITRLDESKQRGLQLQSVVDQQSAAATLAQSRAARVEMDYIKTEAEMRDLGEKLKKTIEFKVELERQLAQYKNMVGFLQAEVSSLSRERDALKTNLQEVDARIERLTSDVSEAQSAVGITSKRLEAKYEAEKREAVAAALERQKQLEAKVALCEARIKELDNVCIFANESLRRFLAAYLHRLETSLPPTFLWHLNRPTYLANAVLACSGKAALPPGTSSLDAAAIAAAAAAFVEHGAAAGGGGGPRGPPPPPPSLAAALGNVPFATNFDFERDSVLGFMAGCWSLDVTLVTISQVYMDKLQADLRAEDGLLGGVAGPRHSLESILYDFFTVRYGCRQASELHLGAFLAAVRRYRVQHPKVRTFARLLGLPEPPSTTPTTLLVDQEEDPLTRGPLPAPAVEFYLSLLNRVHARAGPLIAEAAEGFSLVKCKVLSRLAREFLRGSYSTTRDDVAATSDHIRHMALNDDEKSIDLELALEAMLRSFVLQYNDDFEVLHANFRSSFETGSTTSASRRLITPDDLTMFLRQLNAEKAGALPPSRVVGMYVEACRAAGSRSEGLGREICRAVLNSGFVGISTHVTRHEPIRSLPPYDEFELLEESWRLMRVAVEQQVAVIKSHTEQIKCDVLSYIDLARRVDELIGGRESPLPAWTTYRRLLTTYCGLRETVDAILPFDPPLGTSRRSSRHHKDAQPGGQEGGGDGAAGGEGGEGGLGDGGGGGGDQSGDESLGEAGSGATSRDISPALARRGSRRIVSHKSLGAALSRSSSGELQQEALTAGALTGDVRRSGKLLLPRNGATPMSSEGGGGPSSLGSSLVRASVSSVNAASVGRAQTNLGGKSVRMSVMNPQAKGLDDAAADGGGGGGRGSVAAPVVKLQFNSGGVKPGA